MQLDLNHQHVHQKNLVFTLCSKKHKESIKENFHEDHAQSYTKSPAKISKEDLRTASSNKNRQGRTNDLT